MPKKKWIKDGTFPMQPNVAVPVSDTVLVITDSGRKLLGYYDFSRGTWYVTGIMSGEEVRGWQYLPN